MTRPYLIAAAVGVALAVLLATGIGAWRFTGISRDLDDARDALDTIERIQDAQTDCAGLPWAERLRCAN